MEEILNLTEVFKCPIFKVEEAEVRLPTGEVQKRWFVVRRPAVVVLPVDEEGKFILTKEFLSAAGKTMWRMVTGDIEDGESPAEAARREMREEIGLDGHRLELLLEATHPSSFIKHSGFFFLVRDLYESRVEHHEYELIEPVPCTQEEVTTLMQAGEFHGNFAKVLTLAMEHLQNHP